MLRDAPTAPYESGAMAVDAACRLADARWTTCADAAGSYPVFSSPELSDILAWCAPGTGGDVSDRRGVATGGEMGTRADGRAGTL